MANTTFFPPSSVSVIPSDWLGAMEATITSIHAGPWKRAMPPIEFAGDINRHAITATGSGSASIQILGSNGGTARIFKSAGATSSVQLYPAGQTTVNGTQNGGPWAAGSRVKVPQAVTATMTVWPIMFADATLGLHGAMMGLIGSVDTTHIICQLDNGTNQTRSTTTTVLDTTRYLDWLIMGEGVRFFFFVGQAMDGTLTQIAEINTAEINNTASGIKAGAQPTVYFNETTAATPEVDIDTVMAWTSVAR